MNGRTNSNGIGTDILQVPLDPPVNLTATAGNAKVSLTWVDPVDKYATPEGETAQDPQQLVSEWDYTVVVRKVGSQPNDPNDGTVVTKSSIINQYQTSPYEDTGLINDTVYFYGVFAVNKDGVASDGCISDSVTPKAGVPVSTLSTGTIIKINENGAPVEYIVIQQGKPHENKYDDSCDGTWVLRKDIHSKQLWNSEANNDYKSSTIHNWLNTTFRNTLSQYDESIINTAKIPYRNGNANGGTTDTGANGLPTQIFLLALCELLLYTSLDDFNEGAFIQYFSSAGSEKAYATYNGIITEYWTRSPVYNGMSGGKHEIGIITTPTSSSHPDSFAYCYTGQLGVRPAFILNPESIISLDMILLAAN